MSRNFMPQSGALAPYVVVNRDAAVAGVFSVDGLRGSVDLTTKYLTIANFNAYKTTTDSSISSINQSIAALNTVVSNKAAKGANSDITSITGLTTALGIAYGGTGGKSAAEARANLELTTAATTSIGTDGACIPLLNGVNTWETNQTFSGTQTIFSNINPGGIEIGSLGTAGIAYIDLHSSGTGNDYDVRIRSEGGNNTVGKGTLSISADLVKLPALELTSSLGIAFGGTGATNAAGARNNFGLGEAQDVTFAMLHLKQSIGSNGGILHSDNYNSNGVLISQGRFYSEIQNGVGKTTIHTAANNKNAYLQYDENGSLTGINNIYTGSVSCSGSVSANGTIRGVNNYAFTAWPNSDPDASVGQIRIAPRFQSRFNNVGGAGSTSLWFEEHVGSNHRAVIEVFGYGAATQYWHFRSDGMIWNTAKGDVSWAGTSDLRYKDNVVDYDGLQSLENIKAMNLIKFTYKDDERKRERRGVAAQQVMEIDPCYVKKSEGSYIDANGEQVSIEKLVLDTNPLLMDALCAIKALSAQVDEMKEEIKKLKGE